MSFVNPLVLFGLIAIIIPILYHLFNLRRYRKIYFTNVRLLKQIKQETKKQSRLKHLLVLLSRILAICCIVFAFAQPFIPLHDTIIDQKSDNAISIYIDNSFSMEAESDAGSLLSESKMHAEEIVKSYKQSDLFNLVTNDFESKHDRFVNREEIIDAISEITFTPRVKYFSEVLNRMENTLSTTSAGSRNVFILSDFQKSFVDEERIMVDSQLFIFLVPQYSRETNNLFIDSCWFESPIIQTNQPIELNVLIQNSSSIALNKIPVKLIINGFQKSLSSFDVLANDNVIINLTFQLETPGIKNCELKINDYPITYDDKLYFSFEINKQISILTIYNSEPNRFLGALFGNDSIFNYISVSSGKINYSDLPKYDVIILDGIEEFSSGFAQEISGFVRNRGTLVVFPSKAKSITTNRILMRSLDISGYSAADTIETRIDELNLDHPIFKDVFDEKPDFSGTEKIDLPVVRFHYGIRQSDTSLGETIIKLQNDEPFLIEERSGNGFVYLFASPIDNNSTNFQSHAIFVPVLYRIAMLSQVQNMLFYTIGKDNVIKLTKRVHSPNEFYYIRKINDNYEFIPEVNFYNNVLNINSHDNINISGTYNLVSGETNIASLAYNYDRNESDLNFLSESELNELIETNNLSNIFILDSSKRPVSQSIKDLNEGIRLWKLFVILALSFLVIEGIILRFWK